MPFVLAMILLQLAPQLPDPDAVVTIGGEVEGPYIFREDVGQTTKVILKNGLTVILRESNAMALTSVTTLVKAGRVDEPADRTGIAQVVERMVAGSIGSGGGPESREEGVGAARASHTEYDRTVYAVVAPAENAVRAIEELAEALWNPEFEVIRLARELDVVWLENQGRNGPADLALDGLYGLAFTEHRLGRSRFASHQELQAITQPDLTAFYDSHYQPSNAVVAVVGQFEREFMLEELIRIHEGIENVELENDRAAPVEPDQNAFRYDWARGANRQVHVAMGYRVPGPNGSDADVAALEVLSTILSGGRASRMSWFLRDEQELVSDASSSYNGFEDIGFFTLQLETDSPDPAEIAVLGELDRIRRFGVIQEELDRAKVWIGREYYRRLETVQGLGREIVLHEAAGDWKTMHFFLESIRAVTRDDIQRVTASYFGRDSLSVFEYLPETSVRALTNSDFEASVLTRVPANVVQRSIEEQQVTAEVPLVDDELVMDVIEPVVRRSILRGPEVYIAEDHRLPLVSFGIFYPGGRLYETPENAGITDLMLRSALRGTLRFNTADISRRLENAGARIEVVNEPDYFGYVLDGISGQMDEALGVLVEILQEPTFPEAEVEHEKALQTARIHGLEQDRRRHASELFASTVFGEDSYGRPPVGSEESVSVLTANDLAGWHDQHQRTLVPLIVVAGDTGGTGLVASIAEALTNEDLFPRDISTLPVPGAPLDREEHLLPVAGGTGVLVYGMMVSPYAHPDSLPLSVVGSLLSERLSRNLFPPRTLDVSVQFMARAGTFRIESSYLPPAATDLIRSIETEIQRLIDEGVTADELAAAIDTAIGGKEAARQTRHNRVLELAATLIAGGEASSFGAYPDMLRQLDTQTVRAAAGRYLNASQAKVLLLSPTD